MKGSLKAFLGYLWNRKCPEKGRKAAVHLDSHKFLEKFLWEVVGDRGFTYWHSALLGMGLRALRLVSLDFAEL